MASRFLGAPGTDRDPSPGGSGRVEGDAEAVHRQPEQHRAGPEQIGDPAGAERLELGEPPPILGVAGRLGAVQDSGVGPYLAAGPPGETPAGGGVSGGPPGDPPRTPGAPPPPARVPRGHPGGGAPGGPPVGPP